MKKFLLPFILLGCTSEDLFEPISFEVEKEILVKKADSTETSNTEKEILVEVIDTISNSNSTIDTVTVVLPPPNHKNYLQPSYLLHQSPVNLVNIANLRVDSLNDDFTAVANLDINGDGQDDFIIHPAYYNDHEWTNIKTPYEVWFFENNTYVKQDSEIIFDNLPKSYLAYRALVGDFDNDGDGDVFFAATGIDLPPYPQDREPSLLILNDYNQSGKLIVKEIDFFASPHDATAADFDNDGDLDIFSIGAVPITYPGYHSGWIENLGNGVFQPVDTFYNIPFNEFTFSNINASEAADINNDGYIDIIYGGHEWVGILHGGEIGYTRVFFGDNTKKYNMNNQILIPQVQYFRNIQDYHFFDFDNDNVLEIIILRSGDGLDENNEKIGGAFTNEPSTYYGGYYVQIVKLVNDQFIDITHETINNNFIRSNKIYQDAESEWIKRLVIQDYDDNGTLDLFNPPIFDYGLNKINKGDIRVWEFTNSIFNRIQ